MLTTTVGFFHYKEMYVQNADAFCNLERPYDNLCHSLKSIDDDELRIQRNCPWRYIKYQKVHEYNPSVATIGAVAGGVVGGLIGSGLGGVAGALIGYKVGASASAKDTGRIIIKISSHPHQQPESLVSRIARINEKLTVIKNRLSALNHTAFSSQTQEIQHEIRQLWAAEGYFENYVLRIYADQLRAGNWH